MSQGISTCWERGKEEVGAEAFRSSEKVCSLPSRLSPQLKTLEVVWYQTNQVCPQNSGFQEGTRISLGDRTPNLFEVHSSSSPWILSIAFVTAPPAGEVRLWVEMALIQP